MDRGAWPGVVHVVAKSQETTKGLTHTKVNDHYHKMKEIYKVCR